MTPLTINRDGTNHSHPPPPPRPIRPLITPKVVQKQAVQFASALAHEVRNPLTNINLSVTMLESILKENDQKIYLDIIKRSSTRINNLINELLKYQQADTVRAEEHSIQQLLDDVIEMTGDRIMLKNIVVIRDYVAQDCKIVLNRPKMKIALANIIVNAIDAMDSTGGQLKLFTECQDDKFIIYIEDNGCGISRENLDIIFEPFFTNKPGGLGIGLATTQEILRSNHVEINVASEEGLGTCFTLCFEKNLSVYPFNR